MAINTKTFLTEIDRTVLPLAERVSAIPALNAIRAALIVTLPIVFLGSLAELMISFPLPAYKAFMLDTFGPGWRIFGRSIQNGTFAVMSLVMLFSLGQHLAERYNAQNPLTTASPVIAGLISFVSFLCLLREDPTAGFSPTAGSAFPASSWPCWSGCFPAASFFSFSPARNCACGFPAARPTFPFPRRSTPCFRAS